VNRKATSGEAALEEAGIEAAGRWTRTGYEAPETTTPYRAVDPISATP